MQLYQTFADAWRATDSTSLFDYASGASTATFTKHDFPSEQAAVTYSDLTPAQQAAGAQACAGVSDPELLQECKFDVAITGQSGFGEAYQLTQTFQVQGTQALGPTGPVSPTPTPAPVPAGVTSVIPTMSGLQGQALGPDGTLYVSISQPNDAYQVVAIDAKAGKVLRQVDAKGGGIVEFASGSVWVGDFTGGTDCSITRLDASSLDVQATIPVPCYVSSAYFTAANDAVWYYDFTTADLSGKGGTIRRIDPSANKPAETVTLPFLNGYLAHSATSIVYTNTDDQGTFLLTAGATQLVSIGTPQTQVYPVSNGAWTSNNNTATFYGPGGTQRSFPVDGPVIAADENAVYVDGASLPDGSTRCGGIRPTAATRGWWRRSRRRSRPPTGTPTSTTSTTTRR